MTPLQRDQFGVTAHCAYLNHAAVGVLPASTVRALHEFVDAHAQAGVLGTFAYERRMEEYRARIGRFIGAKAHEIAVLRSTSEGANVLAGGFPWNEGDEVILPEDEFPSNAQPWLALRQRSGVHVRIVRGADRRLTPDVLRRIMSPATKAVAVSWVAFADGYRRDLAALSEITHSAGGLFFVDAIQGLGAFPIDVEREGIDALYCGGAKWLMALQGVSFLYISERVLDRIRIAAPGWRSLADAWNFADWNQPYAAQAARFEAGTPNFAGALSLVKSLDVLQEAGVPQIAEHVLALTDRLTGGLRERGAEVISVRSPAESSGIVTFRMDGSDPIALGKALASEGIITTYRANGVRIAPHGYNTGEEIDRVVQVVAGHRRPG